MRRSSPCRAAPRWPHTTGWWLEPMWRWSSPRPWPERWSGSAAPRCRWATASRLSGLSPNRPRGRSRPLDFWGLFATGVDVSALDALADAFPEETLLLGGPVHESRPRVRVLDHTAQCDGPPGRASHGSACDPAAHGARSPAAPPHVGLPRLRSLKARRIPGGVVYLADRGAGFVEAAPRALGDSTQAVSRSAERRWPRGRGKPDARRLGVECRGSGPSEDRRGRWRHGTMPCRTCARRRPGSECLAMGADR